MTDAEFAAIVDELHGQAKRWLTVVTENTKRRYTDVPPVWMIGVERTVNGVPEFAVCHPFDYGSTLLPLVPVCWINWETRRSDDELRDVLGQALSVLMREMGMEWP